MVRKLVCTGNTVYSLHYLLQAVSMRFGNRRVPLHNVADPPPPQIPGIWNLTCTPMKRDGERERAAAAGSIATRHNPEEPKRLYMPAGESLGL